MTTISRISSGITWVIVIALAVIPVFFLPVTQEYYDTNKWMLLVTCGLITTGFWIYRGLRRQSLSIFLSPVTAGLAGIAIASIISLIFASPNKVEALLSPFGPITFIMLAIITAIIPMFIDKSVKNRFIWLLFGTITCIALISIYQLFGMGKIMFPAITYLSDPLWTPTGSTIASVTLYIIIIPLLLAYGQNAWKTKNESRLAFLILMTLIVLAGLALTLWQLVTRIGGNLLPISSAWSIALEIFKNPKQALVGVGAENFLAAFSAGRSGMTNVSAGWNIRFTTSATTLFHLLTIYGIIGGVGFFLLGKSLLPNKRNILSISLLLGLLTLLLTPPNLSVLIVIALLPVFTLESPKPIQISVVRHNLFIKTGLAIFFGIVVGGAFFLAERAYAGELVFYQSLRSASDHNGTATYALQTKATGLNPYMSRYHITFSQTNLALAASLANSIATSQNQDKTTTEEQKKDRELVTQLISQSIQEAKIAVKLNSVNVLAWENLARIYQQLIGVAQGSETWATASFQRAIELDPTNPSLHVELGSVYITMKDYTHAIGEFARAASLKPNYTNAYYNLSNAYKLNNDITQAIAAMEQTARLVDKQSNDYKIVTEQLDALKNGADKTQNTPSSVLTQPTPVPVLIPSLTLPR